MLRTLCLGVFLACCSASYKKNDLTIPNVSDLDTSQGSIGNIGFNPLSGLPLGLGSLGGLGLPLSGGVENAGAGVGNIASTALSSVSGSGGNDGNNNEGESNNDNNSNIQNDLPNENIPLGDSIGNVANIAQSAVGGGTVGSVAGLAQSNIGNLGDLSAILGTLGNSGSSNEAVSNLANIAQTAINGGGVVSIGNPAETAPANLGNLSSLSNLRIILGGLGNSDPNSSNNDPANIAPSGVGQNTIGNVAGVTQPNVGNLGNLGNPSNLGILENLLNLGSSGNSGRNNAGTGNSGNKGSSGMISWADVTTFVNNNRQNNNLTNGGGIGNIANIVQSNVGGVGVGNIAGIAQIITNGGLLGLIGLTINNEFIERPCQVFDTYCIKKYFAEHSKCKIAHGPVPDPFYRHQSTMFLARINVTTTAADVLYGGLNGRIEDFFIDRETDRLVVTIEFRNLTFYSKYAYFRFHRRAKEPIVTRDYLYFNYRSVVSTIVIPIIKDLQLEKSETFIYSNDLMPTFSIGPNGFGSPDPTVQRARLQLLEEVRTVSQEAQLTEGAFYTATYLQHSICDFGLKIL